MYGTIQQYSITWDIQAELTLTTYTYKDENLKCITLETSTDRYQLLKTKTYLKVVYEIIQHKIIKCF